MVNKEKSPKMSLPMPVVLSVMKKCSFQSVIRASKSSKSLYNMLWNNEDLWKSWADLCGIDYERKPIKPYSYAKSIINGRRKIIPRNNPKELDKCISAIHLSSIYLSNQNERIIQSVCFEDGSFVCLVEDTLHPDNTLWIKTYLPHPRLEHVSKYKPDIEDGKDFETVDMDDIPPGPMYQGILRKNSKLALSKGTQEFGPRTDCDMILGDIKKSTILTKENINNFKISGKYCISTTTGTLYHWILDEKVKGNPFDLECCKDNKVDILNMWFECGYICILTGKDHHAVYNFFKLNDTLVLSTLLYKSKILEGKLSASCVRMRNNMLEYAAIIVNTCSNLIYENMVTKKTWRVQESNITSPKKLRITFDKVIVVDMYMKYTWQFNIQNGQLHAATMPANYPNPFNYEDYQNDYTAIWNQQSGTLTILNSASRPNVFQIADKILGKIPSTKAFTDLKIHCYREHILIKTDIDKYTLVEF